MTTQFNAYKINDLAALQSRAGAKVTGAIQQASARTGVDFSYLLQQANVESSFNPTAKAKSSSASGLYQFIDSTWLSMVNKYGDKHGLGQYAAKISDDGRVASAADRQKILALRKDPQLASLMAAEYANENKGYLEDRVGGEIGSTELYMAHFMGAAGAGKFLEAMNSNPSAKGAAIFDREACSNPAIFYKADGSAKTLKEIYAYFDNKFTDDAPSVTGRRATTQVAASDSAADVASSPLTGRGEFIGFNENTGKWFKTNNKVFNPQYASLEQKKAGAIPGYQNLLANPVDLMALLEFGQPAGEDKSKKIGDTRSSMWG